MDKTERNPAFFMPVKRTICTLLNSKLSSLKKRVIIIFLVMGLVLYFVGLSRFAINSISEVPSEPSINAKLGSVNPKTEKYLKKVISFGLYGSNPKYVKGAIYNSELVQLIFPGWICRFYVDKTVPLHVLDTLSKNGAEVVVVANDTNGAIAGMFWRFLVADDEDVGIFLVRDSDSRLNLRDRAAVDDFLQSNASFHLMRDHPLHHIKMLGGMWGAKRNGISFRIKDKINEWKNRDNYGQDQEFLASAIWPHAKKDLICHDSFFCKKYVECKPFPMPRIGGDHVGQAFDQFNQPLSSIKNQTPISCRKDPDFIYG